MAAGGQSELLKARLARTIGGSENGVEAYVGLGHHHAPTVLPPWTRSPRRADRGTAKGGLTERPGLSAQSTDSPVPTLRESAAGGPGAVTEQFVALELRRRAHGPLPTLHERDDEGGLEVDIIVEIPDGQLVAIESGKLAECHEPVLVGH